MAIVRAYMPCNQLGSRNSECRHTHQGHTASFQERKGSEKNRGHRRVLCKLAREFATFGVVIDNERRGSYHWFLRVKAHHFRGLFWKGWLGTAGRPDVHY